MVTSNFADNINSKKNLINKIEEKKSLLAEDLGILNYYIEKEEFKNIDAHKDMEDLDKLFTKASGISESFEKINLINHDLKTLKDWKNTLDYSITQIKKSVRNLVFAKLDNSSKGLKVVKNYVSKIQEKNSEYNKEDIFQPKKEAYEKIISYDFKKIDNFKTKLRNAANLKEVLEINKKIDEFTLKPLTIDSIEEKREDHDAVKKRREEHKISPKNHQTSLISKILLTEPKKKIVSFVEKHFNQIAQGETRTDANTPKTPSRKKHGTQNPLAR